MMLRRTAPLFIALLLAISTAACSDDPRVDPPPFSDVDILQPSDAGASDPGPGDAGIDAGGRVDAGGVDVGPGDVGIDVGRDAGGDAGGDSGDAADAGPDAGAGPLGALSGSCGEIDAVEIGDPGPFFFRNTIDFEMDGYDDPQDFDRLSAGGQEIINDGNAGGSSIFSEVFAYEVLHRCEMATLLKTETEVDYTTAGKITDLLVEIDGSRLGVSVTRAVAFPRSDPYSVAQAQSLLEDKLGDVLESSANVAPADAWAKQILHVIADEVRHAEALETAWGQIDAALRADTIVVVTISEGEDDFLY